MKPKCLVCGLQLYDAGVGHSVVCPGCKSDFASDESGELKLIKSGIKLDVVNLIFSGVFVIGFAYLIFDSFNNPGLTFKEAGIILVCAPLAEIIRNIIYMTSDNTSLLELYYAFVYRRLKYFDLGSKSLVYTFISAQLIGIVMLFISNF